MAREVPSARWNSPGIVLPLLVVFAHALCLTRYGTFRDEFYYLACAQRIDWGYVDHPPLSVFLLKALSLVFGESLGVMRMAVALAGAGTVALVVATARRLGASDWGLWLAGLIPSVAGMYLVVFHLYTMNAFEILIWAGVAYLVAGGLAQAKPATWVGLGVLVGLGFLNKYSILWMGAGLLVGLLTSRDRRVLGTPHPYLAAGLALLIALPHVLWQAQHSWVTVQFARNAQDLKLAPIPPWTFLGQQAVVMNLGAVPFLVLGLAWGLRGRLGEPGRVMAWVFLTVMTVLLLNGRSRVNYLAPAYPFLIPLAALATQRLFESRKWRPAWALAPVTALGLSTVPLALPLLPVDTLDKVVRASPIKPPNEEKTPKAAIQGYADEFGWEELAAEVQRVFDSLPEADRGKAVVVTWNYGEAAALEHLARHYRLPPVVCGHNAYSLWPKPDWDGSVAILVNESSAQWLGLFRQSRLAGRVEAPWAMPEQDESPVWVARDLQIAPAEFYERLRRLY
ncbi:MAG: glycosyltransferase family 39 protein [Fimbriimonadaceae bacterium]|nr:glycosyltransferase family 39 protein [Fimbriimonadaceae bacterium]QYK56718.1 MAG: glycosyltransferase family 39 protein [Fimbriimonadaceae bacterium]